MERRRNQDIQVRVERVSYKINGREILKEISFTVKGNGLYLLVGKNGSGKTTLLKILAGLLAPTEGKIYVNGEHFESERLLTISGYVFQNPYSQIIGSTVEEDVAFGLENVGTPREKMRRIVSEVLKEVELYEERKRDPLFLSGGQIQRLAIASILALKPRLLLLDEPLSMIDRKGKKGIVELFKKLKETKILLVATHDIELFKFTDGVFLLENHTIHETSYEKLLKSSPTVFKKC